MCGNFDCGLTSSLYELGGYSALQSRVRKSIQRKTGAGDISSLGFLVFFETSRAVDCWQGAQSGKKRENERVAREKAQQQHKRVYKRERTRLR